MVLGSLGFLFASYPRLGSEEASNQETQIGTDKNSPSKNLLFLASQSRKGSLTIPKSVRQQLTYFKPNTVGTTMASAHPTVAKAKHGVLTSTVARLWWGFNTLTGLVAEKAKEGPSTRLLASSHPCSVSGEHPSLPCRTEAQSPLRWGTWTSTPPGSNEAGPHLLPLTEQKDAAETEAKSRLNK